MASQPTWRLIHTKPQQENTAAENLRRQNYTVYLPMLDKCKKHNGKLLHTQNPLFPRYLFIRLSAGIDDWGPIRSTKGVSNFVRFGTEPVQVPSELIATIQAREDEDGLHHEVIREFINGDKIHITDGPFSGCKAIFMAQRSDERVLILLDVIGKASRVEVAGNSIARCD